VTYLTNLDFLIFSHPQNMWFPLKIKNMKEFFQKKFHNPPVHAPWKFWWQGCRIRQV